MAEPETRTVDEALARFDLIASQGDGKRTACAMTALSWVAGQAWTDHPECAHPLLAKWAIAANDADGTTKEQRADIVRAGASGILDTWWVPTEVILWARSEAPKAGSPVEQIISVCQTITAWSQAAAKQRPDLAGADLAGADLAGANLAGADLAGANLAGANLAGADLAGADLARAYLTSANLAGAKYTKGTIWLAGFDVAARGAVQVDKEPASA